MSLNYNQTNITNFRLEIPDANITAGFKLNVQTALIPGIRIPVTNTPSGKQGLGRASLPGSSVEFDPLVCRFLVDENLTSWIDLYKWIIAINNYMTHDNVGWKEGTLPEFISLHILDNTKENIVLTIHYYGAWCSEMSEIEYTYTEDSDPAVTCVATFHYKYYVVEKDGIIIDTRESMEQKMIKNGGGSGGEMSVKGMHPSMR